MKRKTKKRPKVKTINWKKRCDDLWSLIIRLRYCHCQICNKPGWMTKKGLPIGGLNAHHIIGRGTYLFRHNLNNGHCLCVGCHKFSRTCGPHGGSIIGVIAYADWFKDNHPKQWAWFDEHKFEKGRSPQSFEDTCHFLQECLNNKNYWP